MTLDKQTQTVIDHVRDLSNKGHTDFLNGDSEESRAYYTEAFTLATQTLEHTTAQPDRAHLFRMAASMALCLGNAQEALRLARTGLDEAQTSPLVPFQVEYDLEDVHNAAWMALQADSEDGPGAPTTSPEPSPDSQALEDVQAACEADKALDALTTMMADSWRLMRPDRLDQIAEMMGKRETLLAIDKIPPERLASALLARIASRTEQARDTVGAGLVAIHAEIAVYVEHLRKEAV